MGEKRRPLRGSGELSVLAAASPGSCSFLPFNPPFVHSNSSQWEANPELSEGQQSLIDRFVKLRTASEVCIFTSCRNFCH